jgi:ribokinase
MSGGPGYPRSSVTDLVVATPVYLDLTFVGLESLPALGEERFAGDLLRTPGGGAITAIAGARLGLSAAVAAPIGDDVAGDLVRAVLAEEGVEPIATRTAPRTPTTVVLPFGGDRAMVTIDPGARASAADVASRPARAVAASLDQVDVVPDGVLTYVTCGDDDARAYAGRPPAALQGARAFFVNRGEALDLTGEATVEDAAGKLAELAETVVVTLAADGAIAASGGEIVSVGGERVDNPVDTTGAGDLLVAAYIWADLCGAEPADRLRWAVLYASLAVTSVTGIGGALREAELIEAGTARGLTAPPRAGARV